jgi:hypothetical protein
MIESKSGCRLDGLPTAVLHYKRKRDDDEEEEEEDEYRLIEYNF